MKTQNWRVLSGALIAAVLVGKLMPGPWKSAFMAPWHAPGAVSTAAHVLLFAAVAFALGHAYRQAKWWQVLGLALTLTAVTEALQHFAIERHPSLMGMALDMAGAGLGWCFGLWLQQSHRAGQINLTNPD